METDRNTDTAVIQPDSDARILLEQMRRRRHAEQEVDDWYEMAGGQEKHLKQAVYDYLEFLAENNFKARTMLPPRTNHSWLTKKRVAGITRAVDSQDHIQDLWIEIFRNGTIEKFRGVNSKGQPVRFSSYLNTIFKRCFAKNFKKGLEEAKTFLRIDREQDEETGGHRTPRNFVAVELLSTGAVTNHAADPEIFDSFFEASRDKQKLTAAFAWLRSKEPRFAALLEAGRKPGQAAQEVGFSPSKASRLLQKALDQVGFTRTPTEKSELQIWHEETQAATGWAEKGLHSHARREWQRRFRAATSGWKQIYTKPGTIPVSMTRDVNTLEIDDEAEFDMYRLDVRAVDPVLEMAGPDEHLPE